jgi:hypothetical protein
MNEHVYTAFTDELEKIAGFKDLWERFVDIFRSGDAKLKRKVNYHFSPKAGKDKWRKFAKNVRDPQFVQRVADHPESDPTLALHAKSMHELSRGAPVNTIKSSRLPGRSYEIRRTSTGRLACTCPDWRFKGTVTGNDCKHIKAHQLGLSKAE